MPFKSEATIGDFNIPDIDWNGLTIKNTNQYPLRVSQTFLDIALDMSLEQIVDFPTRGDNQLDLVFTSHPSHKVRCKPLPPIGLKSDHDVVLLDTSLQAVRAKPVKRKIYLWKKADTEGITTTLSNYSKVFQAEAFSSVEDMWQNLKTAITTTMEKFLYVGTNINTYSSNTYDNITCATLYSPRMRRLNYQP